MENILENGFLDEKYKYIINDNKEKNKEVFDFLHNFNSLILKVLYNFDGILSTKETFYIVPAFGKITKLYQACIIMIEYGLPDICESIIRSIYDLDFQMLYVLKDNSNFQRLVKKIFTQEMKKMDYIEKNDLYDYISKEDVSRYKEIFNLTLSQLSNIKCAPDTKQMCEDLGLKQEYIFYAMLCNDTHQNCDVICATNENNVINTLPDYKKVKHVGFRVCSAVDLILSELIDKYAPNLKEEYIELIKEFHKIYKKNKEK